MYLLILISFLHMTTVKPEPVGVFMERDDCIAKASQLNKKTLNDPAPPEGMTYVCYALVHSV